MNINYRRGILQPGNMNEAHMEIHPKIVPVGDLRKPAVIYVHGASGYATTTTGYLNNGRPHWTQEFALAGYVCFGADLGGPQTWGNTTGTDMLARLIDYTQTVPGVRPGPVILYAHSMGTLTSLNYVGQSAANRAKVGAVLLVTPVINIEDIRANNRPPTGGYAGLINNAYQPGGYNEALLGAAHNPQTQAAAGKYDDLPILAYYGLTDTTCVPLETERFADTIGPNVKLIALESGHETASYEAVDNQVFIEFVRGLGL